MQRPVQGNLTGRTFLSGREGSLPGPAGRTAPVQREGFPGLGAFSGRGLQKDRILSDDLGRTAGAGYYDPEGVESLCQRKMAEQELDYESFDPKANQWIG